ncbi:MAG: transposase domain-containing protein [Deltaproteobacteria bacterium]|nr:transposase domain-containing protein [Deltaproteobacteria bacterium]
MKEHNKNRGQHQEKSNQSKIGVVERVSLLRHRLTESIGLPFANILPQELLLKTLKEEGVSYRKRLFCPIITLWAWLSQVLDSDKSCKKALSRLIAYLVESGQEVPSTSTAAYCKARKRLKANWLSRLLRKTGAALHQDCPPQWLWCGRRVTVVDGSTIQMTDTEDNQTQFPQHKKQAKGCGFPIARAEGFGFSDNTACRSVWTVNWSFNRLCHIVAQNGRSKSVSPALSTDATKRCGFGR